MGTGEFSGKSDQMLGKNVRLNSIPWGGGGVVILLVCIMPFSVINKAKRKVVG